MTLADTLMTQCIILKTGGFQSGNKKATKERNCEMVENRSGPVVGKS